MKVGGNESATKFFQQNGGSAALNSKDPKTKYQSAAATKYKEELKKRAARDAREYAIPSLPISYTDRFITCYMNVISNALSSTHPGTPKR